MIFDCSQSRSDLSSFLKFTFSFSILFCSSLSLASSFTRFTSMSSFEAYNIITNINLLFLNLEYLCLVNNDNKLIDKSMTTIRCCLAVQGHEQTKISYTSQFSNNNQLFESKISLFKGPLSVACSSPKYGV